MGLGYALVHPLKVEVTIGADAMRVGFDDGVDIVLSSIGVGDLGEAGQACEAELGRQVDEVLGQFEGLLRGPFGTLMGFSAFLDGEELDLAGIAERVADFLCNVQPSVINGLLTGLLNQSAGRVPVLQPTELALRMRSLATCFLASLEAPLLSGRDDIEAHRGYRAAAMIRLLMRKVFDQLDLLLAQADPVGRLRSVIDEVPNIDEAVVAVARAAGCWVKDNVIPVLRCIDDFRFSASIDEDVGGGGPSGMPEFTTKAALLEFDSKPSPYDREHWLWWMDLATGLIGFATTIFDIQRASNPPARVGHFISDLFLPAWIAFRVLARAFAWPFINGPPEGTASDARNRIVRFLFSDFGDFSVQLFLHFIGSISDMFAWSNWLSGFGLRILRYFFYVLQPRMIYLFFRSAWYVKQWDQLPEGEKAGGIPIPRFAWLMFGPVAAICFIVGILFGALRWEDFSIRREEEPWWLVLAGGAAAIVAFAFLPPMVLGRFKFFLPEQIKRDQWQSVLVGVLFVFILLLAMLTFFQTDKGIGAVDTPGKIVGWIAGFVLLAVLPLIVVPGVRGGWSDWSVWFAVLLASIAVPGVMMVIAWWFAIADGSDRQDVFDNRDPSTSPWLLPYPAGESWLCGQDFHGFFSHEMLRPDGTANTGNHYSYDLNEDFGKRGLAARTGIVTDVRDGLDDHNTEENNMIEIQNLDWAEGHDPGWDLERGITYSGYLHIQRRGARVTLGQLVRQGRHIADVDDTGVSAMNHLHFMGETGQNSNNGIINMPIVFRDQSMRRRRSAGMISGKPISLAYFSSDNSETQELSATTVGIPLSTDAGHAHTLAFGPGDLAADGTIPDPVTLTTTVAGTPAHLHRISLPRALIEDLLRRRDIEGTTATVAVHAHTIQPLPVQPVNSALSGPGTAQNAVTFRRATFELADPPSAQLLARRPGPYSLLGEQMLVRVNARATEWFSFGAHRPRLPADLVLDRGPGSTAGIRVQHGSVTLTPSVGAALMPRAAARRLTTVLQAGGANVAVRPQPVLVIETRRRGSSATIQVTSAPPSVVPTATGPAAGSGLLPRLDQVTRQQLRDLIVAGLTQQTGVPTIVTSGAGNTRTITSAGAALTGFGGSTPRIERVLGGLYDPASRAITEANPLPLTSGIARLRTSGGQTLDVPISGSPARVVITDLAAARLTGADLTTESLTLQVRDDSQAVTFDAADTSPEAVARRIASQAEGVRAWAQGGALVLETVAAGDAVRLTLTKGGGTFPAATPGAAPQVGGATGPRVGDSTAVTLTELDALIAGARAEAILPTAPATVTIPSGALRIAAAPGTPVAVEGPADLMAALGVPAAPGAPTAQLSGTGQVEFTGLPNTMALPVGGWFDVTVGTDRWRVDMPAEPARAELVLEGLPADGQALQLTVNGTAVTVGFAAADVASTNAVAARVSSAVAGVLGDDGVTVRLASRCSFESAVHGRGDLQIGGISSPGSASAGMLAQGRSQPARGSYDDTTAVTTFSRTTARDGRVVRAFGAAFTGSRLDVTATDGGAIAITPAGADPFGLVSGSVTGGPFAMGAQSLAYDIEAGRTTTTVEFNAAPAHVHTVAGAAPVGIPADAATLTVTTTAPDGTVTAGIVDLGGVTSIDEAAARIQREAPHVVCWSRAGTRLDIDTPGGGTGWRLRLEPETTLIALGFDPQAVDDAGGITASGGGNVPDGNAATRGQIRDVVQTMGGLATFDPDELFTATASGAATARLVVDGRTGSPALRSTPPAVAGPLGATVAGNRLITVPGRFRLDSGWLILEVGGEVASVGALWGRRAWLEAPDPVPADPTADLESLRSASIRVRVDGVTFNLTLPGTAFVSVEALLGHLNRNVGSAGNAWFGLVRRGGARHVRIESRSRGSRSDISLEFPSGTPALGFTAATTNAEVPGGGSVENLNGVTAAELRQILDGGRGFTDTPQQSVEASVAGTDLRLVARGGFRTSLTAPVPPEGVALANPAGRPDILTGPYAAPLDTGTHLTELQTSDSNTGPAIDRRIHALLRAEPARIGPMALPGARPSLNGKTLAVTAVGTGFTVRFSSVAGDADLIDQIERAGEGLVRATVVPIAAGQGLVIETIAEGTSASLSVNVAGSTVFNVLGTPSPAATSGSGDMVDVRAVSADEYRAVLAAGRQGPPRPTGAADRSSSDRITIGSGRHTRLISDRWGARSSLELLPLVPGADALEQQLASGPAALRLDRSLAWGPAIRASVALPPLPGPVALNGDLSITLNDNGSAVDVAPTTEVRVPLTGSHDARSLADAIDAALAGVGSAGAFPDGSIVVETHAPGLTGTVRLPSQANTSTPAVLTALGLTGPPLSARGWPGAGIRGGLSGFRGYVGDARADATWTFTLPGGATISHTVTVGQTAAQVAAALDPLLRAGGARIGVALIGEDGALCVEFFGQAPGAVTLPGGPTAVAPEQPRAAVIWEGADLPVEPAFELRPAWTLRTFRAVFFHQPDDEVFPDPAAFAPDSPRLFDVGWIRPPTDGNGAPQAVQRWAPGRWLFAARAEGARSDSFADDQRVRGYSPAGEMIVSGGTATVGGETVHFARQARYWIEHDPTSGITNTLAGVESAPLRVVRLGDEFLVDHIVFPA